jgi:RimJ/RimL family protein N-acetyltransferase
MAADELPINIRAEQRKISRTFKGLEPGQSGQPLSITTDKGQVIGSLAAITTETASNPQIIAALTRWRQKYMRFFLTQFEATESRTAAWLENVVLKDDTRILFLILDEVGREIGNFGVANIAAGSAELDNLIRGERGGDSRLIFFSELALMRWIYRQLKVDEIYLHVFSNNPKTIALHQSVGFSMSNSWGLIKQESADQIRYEVDYNRKPEATELVLVRMRLSRDEFFERYPNEAN